jgi:hypothetical protein
MRSGRQMLTAWLRTAAPWHISGAVVLTTVLTMLLLTQARIPPIQLGTADAALLAGGFHGKEVGEGGRPFRWTNGYGIVQLPAYEAATVIVIGAQSGRERAVRLTLQDDSCRIAVVRIVPQHRVYRILQPRPCATDLLHLSGVRQLLLLSPTIPPRETDQRALGVAVSSLQVIRLTGSIAWEPIGLTALSVGLIGVLSRPQRGRRQVIPWLAAIGLPLLFALLVWTVPLGWSSWLPLSTLPWVISSSLTALAVARVGGSRAGAWPAAGLLLMVLLWLLVSLQLSRQVDGPDFNWHASRSSDWQYVFRAHGYYPIGFPFILRLGEVTGIGALAAGRTAATAAALIAAAATVLLAGRVIGRRAAWLAALLLIGAPISVAYGVLAATDALFSAAVALALPALSWSAQLRIRHALLGGLALGLAYLFRFQALIVLLPVLIWAVPLRCADCAPLPLRRQRLLRLPVVLILTGFLIGSAPQWLTELVDTGRPINSRQHTNIWNFAFARYDSIPAEGGSELWYVLSYDPGTLARNWLGNLRGFFETSLHELLVWPLGLVLIVGLAAALGHWRDQRLRLLLLTAAMYLAVVALTYNKARFFLPLMPTLITLTVLQLTSWQQRLERLPRPVGGLLGALLVITVWLTVFAAVDAATAELIIYSGAAR